MTVFFCFMAWFQPTKFNTRQFEQVLFIRVNYLAKVFL